MALSCLFSYYDKPYISPKSNPSVLALHLLNKQNVLCLKREDSLITHGRPSRYDIVQSNNNNALLLLRRGIVSTGFQNKIMIDSVSGSLVTHRYCCGGGEQVSRRLAGSDFVEKKRSRDNE